MNLLAVVTLLLTPWHGASFPTVNAQAAKYRLTVRGTPGEVVRLRASGLAKGWIASFCTEKFCSPFAYAMTLDGRGNGEVEFQAIRVDDSAPMHTHVVVGAGDGARSELDVTASH